jgi:hypothetical protein
VLIRFQPHRRGCSSSNRSKFCLGWHPLGRRWLSVLFLPLTALLTLFVILYAQPHHLGAARRFRGQRAGAGTGADGDVHRAESAAILAVRAGRGDPGHFPDHALWNQCGRGRAAGQFVRSMLGGLAMLLAGILLLGWNHAAATQGVWSFDLPALLETPTFRKGGNR